MEIWTRMFAPDGRPDAETASKLCFASDDSHFFQNMRGYLKVMAFHERLCEALILPAGIREKIDRANALALLKV